MAVTPGSGTGMKGHVVPWPQPWSEEHGVDHESLLAPFGEWHLGGFSFPRRETMGCVLWGFPLHAFHPREAFVTLNVATNSTKHLLNLSRMPWVAYAPSMANS